MKISAQAPSFSGVYFGVPWMATSISSHVDIVKELRLRRWAREHYVPAEDRAGNWHPIVLEEMGRRDRELDAQEQRMFEASARLGYVPLVPTPVRLRHDAHTGVPVPNFLSRVPMESGIYIPG